jgi:hypothetical protein
MVFGGERRHIAVLGGTRDPRQSRAVVGAQRFAGNGALAVEPGVTAVPRDHAPVMPMVRHCATYCG